MGTYFRHNVPDTPIIGTSGTSYFARYTPLRDVEIGALGRSPGFHEHVEAVATLDSALTPIFAALIEEPFVHVLVHAGLPETQATTSIARLSVACHQWEDQAVHPWVEQARVLLEVGGLQDAGRQVDHPGIQCVRQDNAAFVEVTPGALRKLQGLAHAGIDVVKHLTLLHLPGCGCGWFGCACCERLRR